MHELMAYLFWKVSDPLWESWPCWLESPWGCKVYYSVLKRYKHYSSKVLFSKSNISLSKCIIIHYIEALLSTVFHQRIIYTIFSSSFKFILRKNVIDQGYHNHLILQISAVNVRCESFWWDGIFSHWMTNSDGRELAWL